MKQRRAFSLVLAIIFSLVVAFSDFGTALYTSGLGSAVKAAGKQEQKFGRYYYEQLPEEAKGFYDAMYNMYVQGILKTGTEDYDLVKNGHVTSGQLEGYANGNTTLLSYMGAARDAFYADYPEIFYVDFSYLSLRVTKKGSEYCAYLGAGRSDNYFVRGFTSQKEVEAAIAEYEAKVNTIVEGAKKLVPEEGKSLAQQQVKYVHDEIIWHTSYRMENSCKKENVGHIRTAYGALVKGESLCEGYSRAVKAVLDKLEIPCVLVQGGFQRTSDSIEPHMWNYVQIGKEWYGIDATIDDPIPPLPPEGGIDGFECSAYLLVGQDVMGKRHIPDGVMSEANFEFTYPIPSSDDLLFQEVANDNGLKVSYSKDAITGELQTGVFKISYNGMGAAKCIENGKYMLMREAEFESGKWNYSRWAYILPDVYTSMNDSDAELTLNFPSVEYLEFAVTSEAPGDYKSDLKYLSFHGNPLLFDARTEILYNPNGTYTPPPYVKKATPGFTSTITVGKTHHMTIVYDEELTLAEGAKEANIKVSVDEEGTTALENSKLENFSWKGDTISFDFTPSKMWLDDMVSYFFDTTGLIGKKSGKVPKNFCYTAAQRNAVCAYRARGYYWNFFGRPQLLENSDLSQKNFQEWKTEDGSSVTPEMMTGLTLVASSPSHAQTDTMNDMVNEQLSEGNVLKSETYNIRLLTCKQNVVSVGDSIRLSVGFPPGYGANDEGVTFKAYHFKRDKNGEIIGMEEVPCTITQYGLVILCKSFSPFAIVAAKDDTTEEKKSKSLLVSYTQGGKVSGDEAGIVTLKEGESKELTIQADDNYVIDAVIAGGKYQEITDKKSMKIKIDSKEVSNGDIIEAQFVTQTAAKKEEERGETAVHPNPKPASIKFPKNSISVKEKERIEIAPEITVGEGIHSYQWYKDGVALEGETGKKLTIPSAAKKDAGKYSLTVTTTIGAAVVKSESSICKVTVTAGTGQIQWQKPLDPKPNLAAVSGLKAVSEKAGRVKLQWNKVSNADGYQVLRYDSTQKKYVAVANVTATAYTDKKRTAGKPCRYKVMAFKRANARVYYGPQSQVVKVIVKPKTPAGIKGKRLSRTSVQLRFKTVKNANSYWIYQYKKSSGKKAATYKIQGKKLYRYNQKSKRWRSVNRIKKAKNGTIICTLTDIKQSDKKLVFRMKASVSKKGYKTQYSAAGKKVIVK